MTFAFCDFVLDNISLFRRTGIAKLRLQKEVDIEKLRELPVRCFQGLSEIWRLEHLHFPPSSLSSIVLYNWYY